MWRVFCHRKHVQNKNVCIIRPLLCVEVRQDDRSLQHEKKNRATHEGRRGGEKKRNIFKAKYSLGCSESCPKWPHGTCNTCAHMFTCNTHASAAANTQTRGPEMVLYCPGDGIRRQLQIRSVGFPLTFSKTCKKCPFHYWLNNVIWAPTGPNRSRQRQSSTHMLRINQITEGEWGREGVRERGKERETPPDT